MEIIIISIGRQFGSGGQIIGKKLADKMNIEYYDRELIDLAAKEIGFMPEQFEAADEKPLSVPYIQTIDSAFASIYPYQNYYSNDILFKAQSDAILKLANEKSCVIVGRCSDYILRDNPRCTSVFLHSTIEDKVTRICKRLDTNEHKALQMIKKIDKRRAAFYNSYSNKIWGQAQSYDISINVAVLGEDGTVNFIEEFVKKRFQIN